VNHHTWPWPPLDGQDGAAARRERDPLASQHRDAGAGRNWRGCI
jgi:hypothetical protein